MDFPICSYKGPMNGPAWEFQRNAYLRGQRELARWLDSVADTKGASVTFGGKSVEKCVLVKKVDFEKMMENLK